MSENIKYLVDALSKGQLEKFYYLAEDSINNKNLNDPTILNLIGIYYFKTKKFEQSLEFFDKALLFNENIQILNNKANSHAALSQFDKAKKLLERSLELNPNNSETVLIYSEFCLKTDDLDRAQQILEDYISQNNNNISIQFQYGKILFENRIYKKSLNVFNKIDIEKKNLPNVINMIGLNYEALGKFDEAIKSYNRVIDIDKKHIFALMNYANLLRSLRDFEGAKQILKDILKINPMTSEAHRYFSIINKYEDQNDPHLLSMLKIVKNKDFTNHEKELHQIYFAIAKAFEDIGDIKQSLFYLKKGNFLRRQLTVNHSISQTKEKFHTIKKIFSNNMVNNSEEKKFKNLVFIVGMPRSGTTLVEQIISSHSKVMSAGELLFLSDVIKQYYPEKNYEDFAKSVSESLIKNCNQMAKDYLAKVKDVIKFSKNDLIVDKLPNNFERIGFIKTLFPGSKIIHCKRNPKDTCLSIYKNYFSNRGIWFAYDQNELTQYYKLYLDLMEFWKELYKSEIFEINYENLIDNQKSETEKVLSYLELNWEDQCLKFYNNKSQVTTLSTMQVRKPIYKDSINSYERFSLFEKDLFKDLEA